MCYVGLVAFHPSVSPPQRPRRLQLLIAWWWRRLSEYRGKHQDQPAGGYCGQAVTRDAAAS
jgi:hypothetical protein